MSAQRSRAGGPAGGLFLLGLWLTIATVVSFLIPMPSGGFQDVEAYRAVFFHVPMAWAGCLAFVVAAVQAGLYLRRRDLLHDALALGAAETGLVLVALATVTGMIFAKTQWGTWWNWDPRQTSVFFVILLYAAYLALRQALPEDETLRARLSAAYLLLAVFPMLWLVGMFPRLEAVKQMSLHPAKAPFEPQHWKLMFFNFAGLIGLLTVLVRLHGGIARLRLAARERWS